MGFSGILPGLFFFGIPPAKEEGDGAEIGNY